MYHHCLFCQTDLGSNDSVERFPVGRRLAFDAAKGRLWVVCPRCARWNLTQLVAGAGAALTVAAGVAAAPIVGPVLAMGALSVVALPGITTALAVIPIIGTLALRDYLQHDRVIGRVVGPNKRVLTVRAKHLDYAELRARSDGA